jgi:hypothetical protein
MRTSSVFDGGGMPVGGAPGLEEPEVVRKRMSSAGFVSMTRCLTSRTDEPAGTRSRNDSPSTMRKRSSHSPGAGLSGFAMARRGGAGALNGTGALNGMGADRTLCRFDALRAPGAQ